MLRTPHVILIFTLVVKDTSNELLRDSINSEPLTESAYRAGLAFMKVADIISDACFTPLRLNSRKKVKVG